MRMMKFNLCAVAVMIFLFVKSVYGADVKTSGYASVDLMSNYVWRGQKLSNSWVIQPSIGIAYGDFGANIWSNYDSDSKIDEGDTHGEFTETDITISYSKSIDKWTVGGGYIYYALNNANDTQEFYLSVAYDMFLKPNLIVYYDFDEGNGAFISLSVGHAFELVKDVNLNLGAITTYNINNEIMGLDKDGKEFSNFYYAELSSSLNIPVWKGLFITPKFAYSFPLSNDAKTALKNISDDRDSSIFYGGINISLNF